MHYLVVFTVLLTKGSGVKCRETSLSIPEHVYLASKKVMVLSHTFTLQLCNLMYQGVPGLKYESLCFCPVL